MKDGWCLDFQELGKILEAKPPATFKRNLELKMDGKVAVDSEKEEETFDVCPVILLWAIHQTALSKVFKCECDRSATLTIPGPELAQSVSLKLKGTATQAVIDTVCAFISLRLTWKQETISESCVRQSGIKMILKLKRPYHFNTSKRQRCRRIT